MSRIKYSKVFLPQTVLLKNILTKNKDDGEDSVLLPFLELQAIDVAKLAADTTTAIGHNTAFLAFKKKYYKERQQRDAILKPIFKQMNGMVQYLKILSGTKFKALGDWDITITDSGKINLPVDVVAKMDLFKFIKEKNDGYPAGTSPLVKYISENDIDFDADAIGVAKAEILHENFEKNYLSAGKEASKRDFIWKEIMITVRSVGKYLKKLFINNDKTLPDWGFEIVATKKVSKNRTSKVEPGKPLLDMKLKIGSVIYNIGKTDVNIHRGNTIERTPVLLKAGESFIVGKGYSHTSVSSVSTVQNGKIKVIDK